MIDAEGAVPALAGLRILLGPLALWHLWPFLSDLRDGVIYSDRFHQPLVSWYPMAGRTTYTVLLWAAVVSAVAMSIGLFTRWTAGYTAAFVGYNTWLSTTHLSHNRAFLFILLVGVTIVASGIYWSVDAWRANRRGQPLPQTVPLWGLWLLRFEVVTVYLASGLSKLLDSDWWSGRVLRLRAEQTRSQVSDAGVPDWILDLTTNADFQWVFSKVAVLTELAIAVGLLWPRTRKLAVILAVGFHLAIEVSFEVQVFSWAAIAALLIWRRPEKPTA